MNAGGRCEVGSGDGAGIETWPIAAWLVPWVLAEAQACGVRVVAVERLAEGGWWACTPEELVERAQAGAEVEVYQRLGCGGLRTTLAFGDEAGWWGAWMAEVSGEAGEAAAWRVVLVRALVRSGSGW